MNSLPVPLSPQTSTVVSSGATRRKLEHVLHSGAPCDEVLRGRVAGHALAQQVQLTLAFGDVPLAAIEFLETPVHSFPKAFDLLSQIRALKVEAKRFQSVTPALCILSNGRALLRALRQALGFAEVDLSSETSARVPARVTKPQHQASRRVEPQGTDELLTQQTPGGRAQDDDPLLVQPDDALIRPEIENLGKVEALQIRRLGMRRFHVSLDPLY